jgi:hypothetical protein
MCLQPPAIGSVVEHGAYASESPYNLEQHEYAGFKGYFAEVLEIHNPPEGKHGILIHTLFPHMGSNVYEFRSVETARAGLKAVIDYDFTLRRSPPDPEKLLELPGFIRALSCGSEQPPRVYNWKEKNTPEKILITAPSAQS